MRRVLAIGVTSVLVAILLIYYTQSFAAPNTPAPPPSLPINTPVAPPTPEEAGIVVVPDVDRTYIDRGVCGALSRGGKPPSDAVFTHFKEIEPEQPIPGTETMFADVIYDAEAMAIRPFTITMWVNTGITSRKEYRNFVAFNTEDDFRITSRYGEIRLREVKSWSSWDRELFPDMPMDRGLEGRNWCMFTFSCDGANAEIYYNDIMGARTDVVNKDTPVKPQIGAWLNGPQITSHIRVFDRALSKGEVSDIFLDYWPETHRTYLMRPFSLGLLPTDQMYDVFDKAMLFSEVPPLHQYPRLLFGRKDLPAIRDMYMSSQRGREFFKIMEWVAASATPERTFNEAMVVHSVAFSVLVTSQDPAAAPGGKNIADSMYKRIMNKRKKIEKYMELPLHEPWPKITETFERQGVAYGFDCAAFWMTPEQIEECEQLMIRPVARRVTKYDKPVGVIDEASFNDRQRDHKLHRRVSNQDVWDTSQLSLYKILLHGIEGHNPDDILFVARKQRYFSRGTLTEMGGLVEPYAKSAEQRMYLPTIALARLTGDNPQFNHPQVYKSILAKAMLVSPLGAYMNDHGTWGSERVRTDTAFANTIYKKTFSAAQWWARMHDPRDRTRGDESTVEAQYGRFNYVTAVIDDTLGDNHLLMTEKRDRQVPMNMDRGLRHLVNIQLFPARDIGATGDFEFTFDLTVESFGGLVAVAGKRVFATEDMNLVWFGLDGKIKYKYNERFTIRVGRVAGASFLEANGSRIPGPEIGEGRIVIGNPEGPARPRRNVAKYDVWPVGMVLDGVEAKWRPVATTDLDQLHRFDFEGVESLYRHKDHGLPYTENPSSFEGLDDIPLDFTDMDTGQCISRASRSHLATAAYSWSMDGYGGHNGKLAGHYDVFGTGTLWIGIENRFAKFATSFNTWSFDGKSAFGRGSCNGAAIGSASTTSMCAVSYDLTISYRYEHAVQDFEKYGVAIMGGSKWVGPQVEYVYRTVINVRVGGNRSVVLVVDDFKMIGDDEHVFTKNIQVPVHVTPGTWSKGAMTMVAPDTPFNYRQNKYKYKIMPDQLPVADARRCRVQSLTGQEQKLSWTDQYRHKVYQQGHPNETYPAPQGEFTMQIGKHLELEHKGSGHQHVVTAFYPYFEGDDRPQMRHFESFMLIGDHRIELVRDSVGRTACYLQDADGSTQSTAYD